MGDIDFTGEAQEIVSATRAEGITLRILGATAFRIHCPEYVAVHEAMQREVTDLDFAAYSKEDRKIEQFFKNGLHFDVEQRRASLTPGLFEGRHIYVQPDTGLHVDVFFDALNMCHVVNFRDRLHLDFPTISLADMTLEKVQIVQLNEKDVKDMLMLFAAHPVGSEDQETINGKYIADLLAKDWGFYHTTTVNLGKIRNALQRYQALFRPEDVKRVEERIALLLDMIERAPKSLKWKARAAVGTKVQWYNDVEDVERATHLEGIG